MGRAADTNRVSVLQKVEECLAASQLAIANAATLTQTHNAMAEQLALDIDTMSGDMNVLHERVQQCIERSKARAGETQMATEGVSTRLDAAVRELRFADLHERNIRVQADAALQDLIAGFVGQGFAARLKWLLFGAVPRPAAAPGSKNPLLEGDALRAALSTSSAAAQ